MLIVDVESNKTFFQKVVVFFLKISIRDEKNE